MERFSRAHRERFPIGLKKIIAVYLNASNLNVRIRIKGRGVKAIDLWVSDGNQATLNAISKKFPDSARQQCVVHKMDNVRSLVPTKQQEQLKGS